MEKKLKNADETEATLVNLLLSGKLIDCGELSISKSTLGKTGRSEAPHIFTRKPYLSMEAAKRE